MDAATFDELLTMVGPWIQWRPLIFCTTSRMKLKVVVFCTTNWMPLATVQLFNIYGATFVTQQSHTKVMCAGSVMKVLGDQVEMKLGSEIGI